MNRRCSSAGFTLTELLVASGLSALLLAGLLTGALALQRGYAAAQHQILCQEDEMRVIDYITRDLRRATGVTISNQNRMLTLTLPDQVDLAADALRLPSIVNGVVQYGNTPATVSYYVSGTAFVRKENGVETSLSTNRFGLEDFSVVNDTPGSTPALVRFTVSFVQNFSRTGGVDSRAATRCSSVVRLRNKADVLVQ
jgi:prepilin-type N-terminal cleavage/methylation domain-containing protein